MEVELIEDVDSYDPKASDNEQLADDWRIVCTWYSTLKDPEKEIKFSEEEIIKLGTTIVREIHQRVRAGSMKHEFDIESMTPLSRELFKKITIKLDWKVSRVLRTELATISKFDNYILFFSGGKDSCALLCWALENLPKDKILVLNIDTGTEFPGIAKHIKKTIQRFSLPLKVIKPEKNFFEYLKEVNYWPTARVRWCNEKLKRAPLRKFLQEYDPKTTLLIDGSRSAESKDRADKPKWGNLVGFEFYHPIKSWSDKKVFQTLEDNKIPLFSAYAKGYDRVSCWCCPLNTSKQFYLLHKHYPSLFQKLVDYEKKFGNIKAGHRFNLPQKVERYQEKIDRQKLGTTMPIFPGKISERHPDLVLLEDFLCRFQDHYLRKPFIRLVGSLPNWGRTDGDIDILFNGNLDEKIVQIESWRIERAFPDLQDRLEFLDDAHWHGPFTNFTDIADLKVEIRPHLFVQEMKRDPGFKAGCEESKKEDKLELFRPFYQPKPTHGRNVGEIYSVDSLVDIVTELWPRDVGIFVGKKYDGTTNQLYKKGDEVKIFSEDGSDLTENLPTIVDQARKIHEANFIVIGELEVWINGKHQPRAVSAGVVGHKGDEDEPHVRLTLYDLLYLDEDIHKESYAERRKRLIKFKDNGNIKVSRDEPLVRSAKELKRVVDLQSKRAGSEGAMLKLADKEYELDESTKWMIKFKNEYALNAKVITRYQIKGSDDTYYYACALKDSPYVGKTFNTGLKLDPGDVIRVIFADISEYYDKRLGTTWFNWWAPHVSESARVIEKGGKVDTAKKAHELVLKTSGRIQEKKLPKFVRKIQKLATPSRGGLKKKVTYEEESEIIRENKKKPEAQVQHKFKPAVWTFPNGHPRCLICGDEPRVPRPGEEPDSEGYGMCDGIERKLGTTELGTTMLAKKKFVLQHHWRGDSVHVDFRYQTNHILDGFTLNDAFKGIAEKYLKWRLDKKGVSIKLYWDEELFYELEKKTEKILQDASKALKDKVFEAHKDLENKENLWKVYWSTGEEKKRKPTVGKEAAEKIWSSKKEKEPYEWLFAEGVTPPRTIEEIPGGTEFYPGIFVTMDRGTYDTGAQKPSFKEFFLRGKNVKGRIVFRQVPGLKETKGAFTWLYWKPDDQEPYVLSGRAIKKEWLPDEGSALPAEIEHKIPAALAYWKKGLSREKKLDRRKKCVQFLKETRKLGTTELGTTFVLSRRWWKGQEVIRKQQQEDFHLKIGKRKFHLSENPEFVPSLSAVEFKEDPGYFKEGTYPPESELNPNDEIPAHIELADQGKVNVIEEDNLSIRVVLQGKILKGDWIFFRSATGETWTFKKQIIPPKANAGRPPLSEKKKYFIREIYRSTGSINETRRQTGHAKQTIYEALRYDDQDSF